jgi:hypothetical protein
MKNDKLSNFLIDARHEITGTEVAIKIINKKKMKQDKMNKKVPIYQYFID